MKNYFKKSKQITQLKELIETIDELEMKFPIRFNCEVGIQFTYQKNDLEYIFIIVPIKEKGKDIQFKLYDKLSLICKSLISFGPDGDFPYNEYFHLEGSIMFPKIISFDEVILAVQNIDLADAYQISKKFW